MCESKMMQLSFLLHTAKVEIHFRMRHKLTLAFQPYATNNISGL